MKSGYLLILGMCLACINVVFLYHFWWAIPGFLWLIILLYRKFNFRLLSTFNNRSELFYVLAVRYQSFR